MKSFNKDHYVSYFCISLYTKFLYMLNSWISWDNQILIRILEFYANLNLLSSRFDIEKRYKKLYKVYSKVNSNQSPSSLMAKNQPNLFKYRFLDGKRMQNGSRRYSTSLKLSNLKVKSLRLNIKKLKHKTMMNNSTMMKS